SLGHLLGAGAWTRASEVLESAAPLVDLAPHAFVRAVNGHEERLSPSQLVVAARAARLAAEPRRAVSLLARARRHAGTLAAFWMEAVEVQLALGRVPRALRGLAHLPDQSDVARLELATRVWARAGDHARALALGEQALAL